ncbi:MAG: hypothetical protein CMP76_17095 [Flavobacterium sp.]|uniref:hypothetical protein n=1 Tax=Flavobacterium sp. TaxID=239 RepID=UPI000C50D309|nr:hypothetical protein [Flavobacterium sp.]MBF04995.1 hypothetical protein [Flavobacterium sp.]|tara:strand:+ start:1997 stop:2257 length:261 start_codon:yes stop_codon:yes gene_type:complete
MYTENDLIALGFKKEVDEETGFVDFVNKVTSNVNLVLSPVFEELFIWVLEDGEDENSEATKIIIDTSDLKQAIELCKIIVGIDEGF